MPRAADFLGIAIVPTSGGSGDTSYDYVRLLLMAGLSILATVIWSIKDHRRQDYRALHAWARIWIRYALALCMLTFGAVKVEPEPVPPEGWYRVVSIKRDGEEVPPARADELRWKIISLRGGKVGVRGLDGAVHRFRTEGGIPGPMKLFEVDEKGDQGPDSLAVGVLRLQLSDGVAARLQGTFYGHEVDATLERQNPADFPLMSRRFRWVIEEPYFH